MWIEYKSLLPNHKQVSIWDTLQLNSELRQEKYTFQNKLYIHIFKCYKTYTHEII